MQHLYYMYDSLKSCCNWLNIVQQWFPSPLPSPLGWSLLRYPSAAGFGHVTCFRQWDVDREVHVTVPSSSFRGLAGCPVSSSSGSPRSFSVAPGRRCAGQTCILKPTFSLKRSNCRWPADREWEADLCYSKLLTWGLSETVELQQDLTDTVAHFQFEQQSWYHLSLRRQLGLAPKPS